jgi:hypothetical protein
MRLIRTGGRGPPPASNTAADSLRLGLRTARSRPGSGSPRRDLASERRWGEGGSAAAEHEGGVSHAPFFTDSDVSVMRLRSPSDAKGLHDSPPLLRRRLSKGKSRESAATAASLVRLSAGDESVPQNNRKLG